MAASPSLSPPSPPSAFLDPARSLARSWCLRPRAAVLALPPPTSACQGRCPRPSAAYPPSLSPPTEPAPIRNAIGKSFAWHGSRCRPLSIAPPHGRAMRDFSGTLDLANSRKGRSSKPIYASSLGLICSFVRLVDLLLPSGVAVPVLFLPGLDDCRRRLEIEL